MHKGTIAAIAGVVSFVLFHVFLKTSSTESDMYAYVWLSCLLLAGVGLGLGIYAYVRPAVEDGYLVSNKPALIGMLAGGGTFGTMAMPFLAAM